MCVELDTWHGRDRDRNPCIAADLTGRYQGERELDVGRQAARGERQDVEGVRRASAGDAFSYILLSLLLFCRFLVFLLLCFFRKFAVVFSVWSWRLSETVFASSCGQVSTLQHNCLFGFCFVFLEKQRCRSYIIVVVLTTFGRGRGTAGLVQIALCKAG